MHRQQEEIVSSGDSRLKYVQNALRCLEVPVPLMFSSLCTESWHRDHSPQQPCQVPNTGKATEGTHAHT